MKLEKFVKKKVLLLMVYFPVLIGDILKDLRFDRFSNVQLIIEILHEKVIN